MICLCMAAPAQRSASRDLSDLVNPFIGTDTTSHHAVWASLGGTFPGVLLPFGMVQISPDNYAYSDKAIHRFSLLDHTSGWNSQGRFFVMAASGRPDSGGTEPVSAFSHLREESHPYYYQVLLQDYGILVSYTAGTRSAYFRFVFPASATSQIILSDLSTARVSGRDQLEGKSGGTYFSARLSRPFYSADSFSGGIRLRYPTTDSQVIEMQIGFSATSCQAAANNRLLELPDWDFAGACRNHHEIWNRQLGKIEIFPEPGRSIERADLERFYTAMYHSFFMPSVTSDATEKRTRYTPLYPWDTYRCLHPLLTILEPSRESDMIASSLDEYDRTGWLPTGNMMGNHGFQLTLDAYVKGLRGFDTDKAVEAIRKTALEPPYGRRQMGPYLQYGYVPASITSSVTHTLDFAYNDWAAAAFLQAAGKGGSFRRDAERLMKRAFFYRNLFDPSTSFMRARTQKGDWAPGGYAEGTEWTYSWSVPHDVGGLIQLMGGRQRFCRKLDSCFEGGHYVHDNEPPLHYAYLYDFAGQPWKTQALVRKIMAGSYSNDPGGLPGNDDLGALSSWYVFSALGIYPVNPGRPVYEIGSPLFEKVILHTEAGRDFVILARHASAGNKYIRSARLGGRPLNHPWITHGDMLQGKTLDLDMGPVPERSWGSDPVMAPPSLTKGMPRFVYHDMRLAGHHHKAGDTVLVSVRVENRGTAAGCARFRILDDGKTGSQPALLLEAGHSKRVTTPLVLYRAGVHTIRIRGLPGQQLRLDKVAPVFRFSDLPSPLPPVGRAGDWVTIRARVQNLGSSPGWCPAILYINGLPKDSSRWLLAPGEDRVVSFRFALSGETLCRAGIGSLAPTLIRVVGSLPQPAIDSGLLSRCGAALALDFDQVSDSLVRDRSGSGRRGIIRGHPGWQAGLFGRALQANGPAGDYVFVAGDVGLDSLSRSGTMTMMAWVYPREEENFSDILSRGDWNDLEIKGGNTVINFFSGGWEGHEVSCAVPDSWNRHWHHIAGVTEGPCQKLYIDGRLAAVKTMEARDERGETGLLDYASGNWRIGSNESNPERIFKGLIEDVMVFTRALGPEDIRALMLRLPCAVRGLP